MKIFIEDPSDWEFMDMFWSQGKENIEEIYQAGKLDDFRYMVEEYYPEGIDMTALNDWVAFDWEELYQDLGMSTEIESACHGKSKAKKKKVESKFNTFSSLFIKNDLLKPGTFGIEVDLNGWKIANVDGKLSGGEPAEFNSEEDAKNSEIFKNLANRYGEDKVRTYKQR